MDQSLREELTSTIRNCLAEQQYLTLDQIRDFIRQAVAGGIEFPDIPRARQMEEALRQSEARYRSLFEDSSIPIWEEDFSAVKAYFDHLRASGVEDFRAHFEAHPEAVAQCAALVKVLDVNQESLTFFQTSSKEEIPTNLPFYFFEDSWVAFREELLALAENKTRFESEIRIRVLSGETKLILLRLAVVPGCQETLSRVLVSFFDITERKRAEEALSQSEANYRSLFENSPIALLEEDLSEIKAYLDDLRGQGISDFRSYFEEHPDAVRNTTGYIKVIRMNPAAMKLYQTQSVEELLSHMGHVIPPESLDTSRDLLIAIAEGKTELTRETVRYTLTGERLDTDVRWSVVPGHEQTYSQLIFSLIDITERRRAERALQASEWKYRQMMQTMVDGMVMVDPQGQITDANHAAERILGLSRDQITGKYYNALILRVIDEQGDPLPRDQFPLAIALRERREVEKLAHGIISPDGKWKWLSVNAAPLFDENAQLFGVIANFRDVTARKRAEIDLQKSNELVTNILESISDGFMALDDDLVVTYFNKAAAQLLNRQRQEILGRPFFESIPEARGSIFEEKFTEVVQRREFMAFETYFGVEPYENWYDVRVYPQDKGISVYFQVTTERKRAEDALRKLSSAVEQIDDFLIITDRDGIIEYVNPAFETFTGYSWAEAIGQTPRILKSGQQSPAFYKELWDTILAGETFRGVLVNRKKNGELYYAQKSIAPLRDAQGNITHFVSTAKDITERVRQEAEVEARTHHHAAVAELGRHAMAITDVTSLMARAATLVAKTLGIGYCGLFELLPGNGDLVMRASAGSPGAENMTSATVNGETALLTARVLASREPIFTADPNQAGLRPADHELGSSFYVPVSGEDRPFGLLVGHAIGPRVFTTDERYFLKMMVDLLAQAIEHRRAEIAEHEQRTLAEALSQVAAAINSSLDLNEVLELILTNVGRVVPHDAAHVMLIESDRVRIVRQHGYRDYGSEAQLSMQEFSLSDLPTLRRMIEIGQPIVLADTSQGPDWAYFSRRPMSRSYVGAPIRLEGKTIGFLNLDSATPAFFTPTHAERLQAFANQAAIAIQNAQLFQQSRALATLEERQRLAHDLHDAVSQTLFSASVVAEALPRLWERDPDEVRTGLDELRQLTRGALAEMRTLLMELRPAALVETELEELLRQLTSAFTGKTRAEVLLTVEAISALPPEVQVALYRIAQEALNNIAKHARATRVSVSLIQRADQIELRVSDNGRGFDPAHVSPDRLGLSIMKERAGNIGANLEITSQIGGGTDVVAVWSSESLGE
jgi:PAS domain S-box-containing protein